MSDHDAPESGHQSQQTGQGMPFMPEVTFTTFALSLASSALVQLGEVPDPVTGEVETSLPLAKHSIDVLSMLEEKTRGNLNEAERTMLESLLYELRMKFVIKQG